MQGVKQKIKLSNNEKNELKKIAKKLTAQHKIVRRATIILLADTGKKYSGIADQLMIQNRVVTTWVKRWINTIDSNMEILERLQDLRRPGTPRKFIEEQWCKIMAIACEKPEEYGRPITHWTVKELADEVIKQKIVKSISPRHIGRFLKKSI